MSGLDSIGLGDPRLMAHALSPMPAWLWSADATRVLWGNPPGAVIFGASTQDALDALRFDADDPSRIQVARLAESLSANDVWRLERLRGFGARIGGTLTCQCMRIDLGGDGTAILVVAGERAGADMPFETRLRRLLAGSKAPAAAFTASGKLLDASTEAKARLGDGGDLDSLGAQTLGEQANREGHAEGDIAVGHVRLDRLSAGDSTILLLTLQGASAPAVATPMAVAPSAAAPENKASTPAIAAAPVAVVSPLPDRPLRFVWQMDAAQNFTVETEDFIRLLGPQTAALLGRPWPEVAGALDPEGKVAAAVAAGGTWNNLPLRWPVDGESITVELSGLPLFNPAREVQGYRGFGICRDGKRLHELLAARQQPQVPQQAAEATEPPPAQPEAPVEPVSTVVQFPTPDRGGGLNAKDAIAFDELARELSDRLKSDKPLPDDDFGDERNEPISDAVVAPPPPARPALVSSESELPILDRLPVGILIYRLNDLIYANRAFLEWTGYPTLYALREAGGLDSLFIDTAPGPGLKSGNGGKMLTISTPAGKQMPVQGRLFSTQWSGDTALVLMLNTAAAAAPGKDSDLELRRIESESRELRAVLDTATDGILLIDRSQRVLSANHGAESLFAMERAELAETTFGDLFAPESKRPVLEYFDRLTAGGSAALINQGMEVTARVRRGGLIPLHLSIGQIEGGNKFCAVFRDMTSWKRTEGDLINARRQAETASAAKSDFLAKISHEIRTPLNAIIGFSEVMMEERFGPLGNDRYRQYLRDIHTSGGHLISLLNELLDLSKIEAGKLELTFAGVNLNDLTQQCVAIMQQQANRERVIIRSSLAASLPQIVADARSVRQIVLNLLSNAIKFTGAGAQVIVSTAVTDAHEVVLRVRDTGEGMSEQELKAALEPFRQLATASRWGSSGTGLGLPITKALAEANHASFKISSTLHDGTLVEISFPAARVLA
jgi:PAS domain S-box-containing protein